MNNYYPPTSNPLTWSGIWYVAVIIALAIMIVIFLSARKTSFGKKSLIAFLVADSIFATFALLELYPPQTWISPVFASKTMLTSLWANYKHDYIDTASGRTIDKQTGQTTSEAEGYTMLRAVWMDDEPTFDSSWQWTQANLQRNDHLFSWLYGPRPDGTDGILTSQNGQNSASDADTDIALSLIFAYSRWQNPAYLTAALPIVKNIWHNEVFVANGTPYLGTNNFASAPAGQYRLMNPSYFSPYAYRIFSFVDPQDGWNKLVDSSYHVLDDSMLTPLNSSTSAALPPDWVEINLATGKLSPPGVIANTSSTATQTTAFGYDALRVPWRITLDWLWYGDSRASTTLSMMGFLDDQWTRYHFLDAVYSHDGSAAAYYQTPAMYGGSIGYFLISDPRAANAVYTQKLVYLYNPDTETWKQSLDYYDANIAWFGMALYNRDLPNLFVLNLPSSTQSNVNSL